MPRRRRTATRPRTAYRTYRRHKHTAHPVVDLGPRPVLTIAIRLGFLFGVGFLVYAIFGTSVWSDETLAVLPVKHAVMFAAGLLAVAGCLFTGLQFGWFAGQPEPAVRRTRRSSSYGRKRPTM